MEVKLSKPCKRTARQYPPRKQQALVDGCTRGSSNLPLKRSSSYRGVTRHRLTGRFEAHLWDKSSWNDKQHKKGRQVYLGAYDDEASAAQAYDLAALKYWGPGTIINFKLEDYEQQLVEMESISREEYLATLRRKSSGFSRGVSKYRGVARHHHNGRWEARIGRVDGNKYLYLGTFGTQEEAARAYDLAAIEYRGVAAVTNFDLTSYSQDLSELRGQPKEVFSKLRYIRDGGSSKDLQELARMATHSSPTADAMTGANFGDRMDNTFNNIHNNNRPFLPAAAAAAAAVMSTTPFVKTEIRGTQIDGLKSGLGCEEHAGFTVEEFSEMETTTSGSSDVTSVTEPKEECEYYWSQYTSFELPLEEGLSPQMECESHHQLPRFENYYTASFWNGFMNVLPQGLHEGMEQDSFISNVLSGELPSTS